MVSTVLVTGGSGFIASHLVQQLLQSGYRVHATVRSIQNKSKVAHLVEMQSKHPGHLRLFEADLLEPGSFDEALEGCSVVFHVASPFKMPEMIKDGRTEMLEPALQGTRNVLSGVNKTESVRRVVFTSTIGAIAGDYIDVLEKMRDGILSEAYFNETSSVTHSPYHYSKVMAEKEAWRFCEEQKRWDLVAINPGLVLGPSLSPESESGSLFLLDELMKGLLFYGVPDLSFTTVDVREVALAHIRAAENPEAKGRYIVAERSMATMLQIANVLRKVHASPFLLPRWELPTAVVRQVGPFFGIDEDFIKGHIGIRYGVDNKRSREELGIVYRPLEETLVDHYRVWRAQRETKASGGLGWVVLTISISVVVLGFWYQYVRRPEPEIFAFE